MVKTSGSLVGDSGNRQPPGSGPATASRPSRHSTRTTWGRPGPACSPSRGGEAPRPGDPPLAGPGGGRPPPPRPPAGKEGGGAGRANAPTGGGQGRGGPSPMLSGWN